MARRLVDDETPTRTFPAGGTYYDGLSAPGARAWIGEPDEDFYGGASPEQIVSPESSRAPIGSDPSTWLNDPLASAEQERAYRFLLADGRDPAPVVQVGGHGGTLISWVAGGGFDGVLVSPFESELAACWELAGRAGVRDRVTLVRAPAEQMPLLDGAVGSIIMAGVLHHTSAPDALAESVRCLRGGGRFVSWDIHDSAGYRAGIRLFGKQEAIECVPLDPQRIGDITALGHVTIELSGALTRYLFAAARRLGLPAPKKLMRALAVIDRAVARSVVGRFLVSMVSIHIEKR
jgi:SAM-dependent methyltransferase